MKGKVVLEGLEFHAFHGVYPHERESGNWFEVDLSVETDFALAAHHDDLTGAVNYESLFRIVRDEMGKPSRLLETVAENIALLVFNSFPTVQTLSLTVSKLNPPIGGKCRKATVVIDRTKGDYRG